MVDLNDYGGYEYDTNKGIALIVAILLFSVNLNVPVPSKHECANKYGYGCKQIWV